MNRAVVAYLTACVFLALLLGVQTVHHRWGADVWEHAAVVRAVAENPADPTHPVLPGDAPHPFIVPSSILGAAIVMSTATDPFGALAVVAALNLGLLLAGIWSFATMISPHGRWTALLALGFSLFLWGPNPWGYSGFLHLNQIGQSLPYPSAVAFGAALLGLAAYGRWIENRRIPSLAAALVLAPLVILSHPVATMFLCTVIAAILVRHAGRASAWTGAVGMGLASLAATLVWPYYPYWSLIEASHLFDASNRVLYEGTFLRTLPLWPGFAVTLARLRRDHRDPLGLAILALTGIYAIGFGLERWSLGRVMSPLAFLLQVALADWLVERRTMVRKVLTAPGARGLATRGAAVVLVGLSFANMAPGFARTLPPSLLPGTLAEDERLAPVDHRHRFLEGHLAYGDIVLARPKTGWTVLVYGGKVLAPAHPQAFVDTEAMHTDVETFFAPETDPPTRWAIARRYDARWILVDERDPLAAQALPDLRQMAELAAEEAGLHLLSLQGGSR